MTEACHQESARRPGRERGRRRAAGQGPGRIGRPSAGRRRAHASGPAAAAAVQAAVAMRSHGTTPCLAHAVEGWLTASRELDVPAAAGARLLGPPDRRDRSGRACIRQEMRRGAGAASKARQEFELLSRDYRAHTSSARRLIVELEMEYRDLDREIDQGAEWLVELSYAIEQAQGLRALATTGHGPVCASSSDPAGRAPWRGKSPSWARTCWNDAPHCSRRMKLDLPGIRQGLAATGRQHRDESGRSALSSSGSGQGAGSACRADHPARTHQRRLPGPPDGRTGHGARGWRCFAIAWNQASRSPGRRQHPGHRSGAA